MDFDSHIIYFYHKYLRVRSKFNTTKNQVNLA